MQPSSDDDLHPPIGEVVPLEDESVSLVVEEIVAHHKRALVRRGHLRGPGGFRKRTIVKTIPAALLYEPAQRTQVVSAISQSAQLTHPTIAQIYDATIGAETDEFNIVSECVDGYTVSDIARRASQRGIPIPAHVIVWILRSAADALISARDTPDDEHNPSRLAHGHLHPNNILVRLDGQIKVTDFGLAAALGPNAYSPLESELTGVFDYMPPEQIESWTIDERGDVFSLGVLLYELSLGEHPFRDASDLRTCSAIRRGLAMPPRSRFPDYPEPLERIIERCLAVDPNLRFQSIEEFHAAVSSAFEGDATSATRAAMAAMLTILFPEQAQTNSGKWQLPSPSSVTGRAEGQGTGNEATAAREERQTWVLGFVALAIVSLLFWLLVFPQL